MASKWRPLQRELLDAVGTGLAPLGFVRNVRHDEFRRPFDLGVQDVSYAFTSHRDGTGNTVYAGIRHEALERLLAPFHWHVPKELLKSLWTMAQTLDGSMVSGPRFWSLRGEADVAPVADAMVRAVKEVALPFFEQYSTLEAVLDGLDDGSGSLYAGFSMSAAKTALGAAYLLGRREQFEQIATQRKEQLVRSTAEGHDVGEFLAIVEALRGRWDAEH